MKQCKHIKGSYECGSYAFNLHADNIDQGDLCDVHYWQDQAENSSADYTGWDDIPAGTELNTFKPDWDAMAVMVEEQQRMAKRIEELERPWVGLTGLELRNIARQFPEHHRVFEDHWDVIVSLLHEAGAQLKGKNT